MRSGEMFVHDDTRAARRFSSASTFKVFNTLIALKEGVVSGQDSTFKWDGTLHDIPDWNRDQTLETAFRVSCVWCYQEMARKVGKEKYRHYLQLAKYGALPDEFDVARFWLDGSLQVSAIEQAAFLKEVYLRTLPFSTGDYEVLKELMLAERTDDYKLYAKTGWAASMNPQIGWYVGYVETADDTWVFATNMDLSSQADLPLRRQLTIDAFQAKGILP
jgi:beta-lactamase class D